MITTCQVYSDFKGLNNTWQQGHFRPASFVAAMHLTSMEMFNIRRRALGNNQDITDELRPFLTSVQISITEFKRGGLIKYPKNYSRFEALGYFASKEDDTKGTLCTDLKKMDTKRKCRPLREEEKAEAKAMTSLIEKRIDKIDAGRWTAFQEHVFLGPSAGHAGCTQDGQGFIVKPEEIGIVVLYYLAIPERPTFVYTKDDRHNIICDATKCKNLLWNEELLPEFMSRLKVHYASFISNDRKYDQGKRDTADA